MKTDTKYFGEITYEEEDVLTFPRGLFGFEEERRFLLLPFEGGEGRLFSLESLTTPQLAFVLMNPFALDPAYAPVLQPEELKLLEAENSEDLYYFVTCVVKEPVGDSTVNLRCPVAVNGDTGQAIQVIMEDDTYQMRHLLSSFGSEETGEGAAPC